MTSESAASTVGATESVGRRHHDSRRIVAGVLAVVLCFTLFAGLFVGWADQTLFDTQTFASRTTKLLDSPAVRHEIAIRVTDAIIQNGPAHSATSAP